MKNKWVRINSDKYEIEIPHKKTRKIFKVTTNEKGFQMMQSFAPDDKEIVASFQDGKIQYRLKGRNEFLHRYLALFNESNPEEKAVFFPENRYDLRPELFVVVLKEQQHDLQLVRKKRDEKLRLLEEENQKKNNPNLKDQGIKKKIIRLKQYSKVTITKDEIILEM